jgi:hypothetical protein
MATNLATEAFEQWLARSDLIQRKNVAMYRDFYSGEHDIILTERQRAWLTLTTPQIRSLANVCPLVVDTVAERLSIEGFEAGDARTAKAIAEWWDSRDLGTFQDDVHLSALRDGDGYLIVEWDTEANEPAFYHELADDGYNGAGIVYASDRRQPLYGYKRWRVEEGDNAGAQRLNLYFPDRVERYVTGRLGAWTPHREPGESWPAPWVDAAGQPLGVPVVHFPTNPNGNDYGTSELEAVIPLQRVLTSLWIDLLAAADATGFQLATLTGDTPSEEMINAPRSIWYSPNLGASFGTIPPGDLSLIVESIRHTTMTIAQVSRVPLTMFQDSKAVASAETIVASERGLVAKINDRAKSYGIAWREAMRLAVRLHNAFSNAPRLNDAGIRPRWASYEQVDVLAIEERRANILAALVAAGATIDGALALPALGYTEEEQARLIQGDVVNGITQ